MIVHLLSFKNFHRSDQKPELHSVITGFIQGEGGGAERRGGRGSIDNSFSTGYTQDMSELVALVGMVISVGAALASAWFARKNNVRELENTVDDLSAWAEKAIRATRTTRMREVRAAARESREDTPPPELKQDSLDLPSSPAEIKKALRQKFFGRGTSTH